MLNKNSWNLLSARMLTGGMVVVATLLVGGCAITPTSIVNQPTTAKAQPFNAANNNGAIFNAASYRPTFEDRRPRFVGDIVTINIVENTVATKAGASSAGKDGGASFNTNARLIDNLPLIGGLASQIPYADAASLSASSENSYSDNAAANSSNVFRGSITTTVVDVLPNGHLMVSGEKQVAFDKGTEFIRFSGVVNPDLIMQGNRVPSTTVADARIEYRSNTQFDAASIASTFARFFLSVTPW